uniref:Uncharacterized protein n=1 Tax=Globisporangium ultimum (strain ATCC 200006 / CBS 805.95 / DAOM BR144) TaxID=431595 RepID=K3XCS7_GLOUD
MSLSALQPANSAKAANVAVNAFMRFLSSEGMAWEGAKRHVENDVSGESLAAMMDSFGMYLVRIEGKQGKLLARHSVMSYFRQVKKWLLDQFHRQKALVDDRLLKMARTLEKYSLKRESGEMVKKANACTKEDLELMMLYLYKTAASPTDYQDTALLALFVRPTAPAEAARVCLLAQRLLLRFVRIKTTEEQGLTLFPDRNFVTCPLLAIGLALATQRHASPSLLDHLSDVQHEEGCDALPASISLMEWLLGSAAAVDGTKERAASASGVHSYVNRLLRRIVIKAGVLNPLSPHSFRRDGTQHTNGEPDVSLQWILDRGAWNLSTTNKAFAYFFNTTSEDQKIAKVFSGWWPDDKAATVDLGFVDAATRKRIRHFQLLLFPACQGLSTAAYNINATALDVLTAQLLLHYPHLKALDEASLGARRVEECAEQAKVETAELLEWPCALERQASACEHKEASKEESNIDKALQRQMALIEQLIEQLIDQNKALSKRIRVIESGNELRRRHLQCKKLTRLEPRLWVSGDPKRKSLLKQAVGFMKLFLVDGFALNESAADYKDRVLEYGQQTENEAIVFLRTKRIESRGVGAVVRHFHELQRAGHLDGAVRHYRLLVAAKSIQNPAPSHTNSQYI